MAKVTGIVIIKIGGEPVRSLDGAVLDIGGIKADPVTVPVFGLVGFTGTVMPSKVQFRIPHISSTDVITYRDEWFGTTVVFATDTDTEYLLTDAFLMEPPKLEGGSVSITMCGQVGVEAT